MSSDRDTAATLFSHQVDVSTGSQPQALPPSREEHTELLREVLTAQDRTNALLEELVQAMAAAQKQRAAELNQWRKANPDLVVKLPSHSVGFRSSTWKD